MVEVKDLNTECKPTWCPGCGDFGILAADKMAISELGLDPKKVLMVSGIGCASLLPHWVKVNFYESLHGRALPVASGAKLANKELTVIAHSGDGDGYGIGMGHFAHSVRRNIDMTYIVHDNQVYALTKGQYSPTTEKGRVTSSTPFGAIEMPLNPIAVALASEGTFVARSFSGDPAHMKEMIKQAIQHKGFSLVSIFQDCKTYNRINDTAWWKERVYKLEETDYKPDSREKAFEKAQEWGDKIPIGVFYKEDRPSYEEDIEHMKGKNLVDMELGKVDVNTIMKKYV